MKGFSKDFALRSNFEIAIKTLSVLNYFSDFCLQFSKKISNCRFVYLN